MAHRVARIAALAALIIGALSFPAMAALPGPLKLCTLRPPFECIQANMSGSSYMSGDSPAAFWWLFASLVIAPLMSVQAARLAIRGRRWQATSLGIIANAPGALYFGGTYALVPFHQAIFGLTLVALVGVLASGLPSRQARVDQ